MKHLMDWKLGSSDLKRATDALAQIISDVILASEHFKVKATLIRVSSDSAKVELNGEQYWINQRYCYFGLQQQEPGAEVYIDNRYIQKH